MSDFENRIEEWENNLEELDSKIDRNKIEEFGDVMKESYRNKSNLSSFGQVEDFNKSVHSRIEDDFVQIGKNVNLPKEFFFYPDEGTIVNNDPLAQDFSRAISLGERRFLLNKLEEFAENDEIKNEKLESLSISALNEALLSVRNPTHVFIPMRKDLFKRIHIKLRENGLRIKRDDEGYKVNLGSGEVKIQWIPEDEGFEDIYVINSKRIRFIQKRFGDKSADPHFLKGDNVFKWAKEDDRLLIHLGNKDAQEFNLLVRSIVHLYKPDWGAASRIDISRLESPKTE